MKTKVPWKTDEHGRLLGAPTHDSSIAELSFSDVGCLRVRLKCANAALLELELSGVTDMNLLDVSFGAVVSSVYIRSVRTFADNAWQAPDSALNILFSGRIKSTDIRSAIARIALRQPKALLVHVECASWGAIAAVCADVDVFSIVDD